VIFRGEFRENCRGFAASAAMLGEKTRAFHGLVEDEFAPFRPLA
jgi:hypothetical protein